MFRLLVDKTREDLGLDPETTTIEVVDLWRGPATPSERRPGRRLLLVDVTTEPHHVLDSLAAADRGNVSAIVTTEDDAAVLTEAVVRLCAAEAYCSSRAAAVLFRALAENDHPAGSRRPVFSPREQAVVELMLEGAAAKVIARRLGISLKTVESHKTRIFTRLGVRTQAEAVALLRSATSAERGGFEG